MLRRVAIVTFALATALVACGRQITPDPTNTNLAGRMVVRFRTNGPLNFSKYTYAIVVDTCGGGTPYPNAFATTFNNYSYAFLIGGSYGTLNPTLLQYIVTPGSLNSLNPQSVPLGASTTQLVLNSNQQNTEFQLTFVRAQLDNPLQVPQPCPNATATPSAAPSTVPSGTPSATPTAAGQQVWYFNFFTIDSTTKTVQDSLGIGGAQDTSFNGLVIPTAVTQNYPIFRQGGATLPGDAAAQLNGGEIDNFQ